MSERQSERHNLIRRRRISIPHHDRARRGIVHLCEVICRIKVVACRLDRYYLRYCCMSDGCPADIKFCARIENMYYLNAQSPILGATTSSLLSNIW